MLKVAVTGGIGSGKTTVCRFLELLGVPVYYTDDRAKWLTNNNYDIRNSLQKLLGKDIYTDGVLNKIKMAELIFSDSYLLQQINSIIHPLVALDYNDWVKLNRDTIVLVKEAAILFESGGASTVDKIVTVTAPIDLRVKRVIARSNMTQEQVLKRIENQWSDEEKIKLSDFVISSSEKELLLPQVLNLYQSLINK